MHLRTPKRYTRRAQRRRQRVSFRRLTVWLVFPILIFVGIGIYQNRDMFIPVVSQTVENLVSDAENRVATATAPTPVPTQDPRERLIQASNAWSVGSIERSVDLYQSVLDSVPNDVEAHYRVTLGLIMSGKLEDALAAAEKTVNANPFSADAWAIRAWTFDWNDRPGESIASALMALELEPDNARALAFLSEAYLSLDLTQRALDTVNRALEIDPNSFEAYRARGLINWQGLYDFEAATADFEAAYSLAPNMTYIAVDIAQILSGQQDYQGAIDILKDVVELNPENTQALYWLGFFYYSGLGDYNQAAEYLSRCVQYNPKSISCQYLMGRSQMNLEQITAASDSFQTAINLGSENPYHYWWAGNALIAQGNCSAALGYLRPGYDIALAGTNTDLISDFEALLLDCQVPVGGAASATATPDAEAEAEADTEDNG